MPKPNPLSRDRAKRDLARAAEPRDEPGRLGPKAFIIGSTRKPLRRQDPWVDAAGAAVPLPALRPARP